MIYKVTAAFFSVAFLEFSFILDDLRPTISHVEACVEVENESDQTVEAAEACAVDLTVPLDCTLVMAPSGIPGVSGFGIFTLQSQPENSLVMEGDPILQLVDLNEKTAKGMQRLIWEYLWDAKETGGQYEGQQVLSLIPGVGTLANGAAKGSNLKYMADRKVTNGKLSHAGAGAFTYYQNITWRSSKQVNPGDELLVNYGKEWFQERGFDNTSKIDQANRSVSWLREHGYCLDNIISGKQSRQPYAGRGAFANRMLPEGSLVAPVPVLPLTRESLMLTKEDKNGELIGTYQLLLNYCFGNNKSNILLYPYSPMINLINHASNSDSSENPSPNVYLRWSSDYNQSSLSEAPSQMLLELVASRKIAKGEEIFLNYGPKWEEAWKAHLQSYVALSSIDQTSAWHLNKNLEILPTESEKRRSSSPNPDIFTSCYYQYKDHGLLQQEQEQGRTIFHWKETNDVLSSPRYLRPCLILQRILSTENRYFYKVQVLNRPGLPKMERIPKAAFPHVVTQVPRQALVFSDKLYTTDQHLPTAFRQEIGLEAFPKEWIDLSL